jgi:hypothetical protein
LDAVCVSRDRSLDRVKPQIVLALALASCRSAGPWRNRRRLRATPKSPSKIENPVTRRITLPLRYEDDFLDGPYKATKDIFSTNQAVVPFRLDEEWALITRTKLPVAAQPPRKLGEHWSSGLDNGYTTFFLSPRYGHGFYWDAGPVLYYPTATSSALGVDKWATGPSAAFLKQDE